MSSSGEKPQRPQQRLPAPSLFVGPPSRPTSAANHRPPVVSHSSARDSGTTPQISRQDAQTNSSSGNREPQAINAPKGRGSGTSGPQRWRENSDQSDDKQAEAVWAEMQNTLEEVELSAASRVNVFSADHARALEELRKAQIELAQAWARSEAEDEAHDNQGGFSVNSASDRNVNAGANTAGRNKSGESEKGPNTNTQNARLRSASVRSKGHLEEETENDIALARQRRLANDQYFARVNKGVLDVVGKLEVVSNKMRDVETESQEIWGSEQDSLESPSLS